MAASSILIVDDNPVNLKLTRILLVNQGYRVLTAPNGEEALSLLKSFPADLVLTDIDLDGMNGLELARAVRDRWPRMQMVLATGYSDAAAEARKEFTVLRKPYSIEDLDRALALPLPSDNVLSFRDGTKRGKRPT